MVRYANRSRIAIRVPNSSTPCATHHFPGSLHAPYDLLPLLAVGKVMIKAAFIFSHCPRRCKWTLDNWPKSVVYVRLSSLTCLPGWKA